MAGLEPRTKRWPAASGCRVFLPTRPRGWCDLNKLFNIDMYCLSIDKWFTYGLPPQ